jgi:hypothetical protein
MMWIDYTIDQVGDSFRVLGETSDEVMDKGLYKPGDVFVVNEHGWLKKIKYESISYKDFLASKGVDIYKLTCNDHSKFVKEYQTSEDVEYS